MSKHDDDFEFETLLSIHAEEAKAEKSGAPLTPEEIDSVKKIENLGYSLAASKYDYLKFRDSDVDRRLAQRRTYLVTRDMLKEVADTLSSYQDVSAHRAIVKNDGSYVEYALDSPSFLPFGHFVERVEWEYRQAECGHKFRPCTIRTGEEEYSPGFHLTAPSGGVCLELSEISPVAIFKISNGGFVGSDIVDYTLKVMVSSPKDIVSGLSLAQQAADSLLFELDAKHGVNFHLLPWDRARVSATRVPRRPHVAFPSTSVPREVAALFAFAAEAKDNPLFAFLSYYQVLEYYMPLTSRRDALRRIRREVRDFSFDISDDASVLRVLNAVERTKGLSEEDTLKILVRDCVREDMLTQFFQTPRYGVHFSRNGPIAGAPAVNLKATNETIAVQTAKRVYALRNRIVHAKDDPKYAETPQLLPRSVEANALKPDIALARFLALETVSDAQG
ncbi:hypothetical protein [Streptomyces sp. NBC_00271]|uniref:hypothetical protein n=1 Tax=Streptomyces sp. NBC_00271 TaxID=2975697 RepID=UPI002E27DD4D|nr:hypothetical protein [Streptomyces sp. NBC_00271]